MTTPHVIASSSSSHPQSSGNSGIVGNHYRVGKKIGEGSFGVVFEGQPYFLLFGLQRVVLGPSAIILNFHAIAGAVLATGARDIVQKLTLLFVFVRQQASVEHTRGHQVCECLRPAHPICCVPTLFLPGTPQV